MQVMGLSASITLTILKVRLKINTAQQETNNTDNVTLFIGTRFLETFYSNIHNHYYYGTCSHPTDLPPAGTSCLAQTQIHLSQSATEDITNTCHNRPPSFRKYFCKLVGLFSHKWTSIVQYHIFHTIMFLPPLFSRFQKTGCVAPPFFMLLGGISLPQQLLTQ